MMKLLRAFFVALLFLGFAPAGAEEQQLTDEQLRNYLAESDFAECENSPGGTAIVPLERLQGIVRPASGQANRGSTEERGSR